MSSPGASVARDETASETLRRLVAGPAEGWASLVLLVVMSLTMAWSIDDARWVLGRNEYTDFLAWIVVPAVVFGLIAAKARWPRGVAFTLNAALAAFVLLVAIGMTIAPKAGGIPAFVHAASTSTIEAYFDLVWRGRATTPQVGHFLLILGGITWATAFFASWTTFRHHRPTNAVLAVGTVLVANMAITVRDQFYFLVIFSIAALLLVVRLHVADEEGAWARHRVDEVARTAGTFMRAGLTFVVVCIVGALVLTNVASSAPLGAAWDGVDQRVIEFGSQISRLLPGGGPGTRVGGIVFGQTAAISGSWRTDDTPVATIRVPDDGSYSWRAVAYDEFSGDAWSWTDTKDVRIAAGDSTLGSTLEAIDPAASRREVTFEMTPSEAAPRLILSPNGPATIDRPTRLTVIDAGTDGTFFATIMAPDAGRTYHVTALVPDIDPGDPAGLTANKLRAAGQDYPDAVLATYSTVLPGTIGTETRLLLDRIEAESGATNPYDLARAVERFLRDPANFTYDTDVTDIRCGDKGIVECFVVSRRGYCEYYASTMAMMLRERGIPTRFVEGFLPGDRDANGVELIRRNRSHAWVEVYFPSFGWIDFDPTGGGVGQDTSLPAGPPVPMPSATPTPSTSFVTDNGERDPRRTVKPGSTGATTGGGGDAGNLLLVSGLLVLVAFIALAIVAFVRRPPAPAAPDAVYATVARIAGRLGHGPRPSQTVYEYAGSLGELLPSVRPELTLVAAAKVESTYAHREIGPDRLRQLGAAQRRLRVRLLGLLFRGRDRPPG
ncbi:MAG: transglutaminaseTgpA domain-containing protein [Chloroflexota bacterium]